MRPIMAIAVIVMVSFVIFAYNTEFLSIDKQLCEFLKSKQLLLYKRGKGPLEKRIQAGLVDVFD